MGNYFIRGKRRAYSMKPYERAWLAAAIDGEGTIGVYKCHSASRNKERPYSYTTHVSIANTEFITFGIPVEFLFCVNYSPT